MQTTQHQKAAVGVDLAANNGEGGGTCRVQLIHLWVLTGESDWS